MFLGRSTHAYRLHWSQWTVCGLLVVSTSLTLNAADREKVFFHDGTEKTELPSFKSKENISRPMDGLQKKGAPIGDNVVMPFSQPSQDNGKISKNLEKLLDKERNWIFDNPRNVDKDAELKAMFGVREYKFDNEANGKNRSVVEEYFDGPSNSVTERNRTSGQKDDVDKEMDINRPLTPTVNAFDSTRLPSLAPVTPTMNPFRQQQTLGGLFNNSSVENGFDLPTRGKTQEPSSVQKLLNSWKSSPPAGAQDPINLQVDVSRQELNPVVGGTANKAYLSTLGGGGLSAQPNLNPSGTLNSSMGRSSVFGGLSSGATADMSSGLSIQAPTSSGHPMKPQPAVLPLPRRKF